MLYLILLNSGLRTYIKLLTLMEQKLAKSEFLKLNLNVENS